MIILILVIFSILFYKNNIYAYSYGPGRTKDGHRPDVGVYKDIIESNGGYYIGGDNENVYLTFDCGYENGYTESILNTLKENDVKATFFITGHYLTSATKIVKRMIDEGHIVANHTYDHKHFTKESDDDMLEDIKKLEKKYFELTGNHIASYIRPPAGEFTRESLKVLNENGYTSIFWSLAYKDWDKDKFYGSDYAYNNVISRIHNGAIILMHTVSKDNENDLSNIIKELKNRGYIFTSLDKLTK